MFEACMIDGFGWFKPGDYRRAWLLFDEVEYTLPGRLEGPLWYPPKIAESGQYRAEWSEIGEMRELARRLITLAWRDRRLGQLVAAVPAPDQRYARSVVESDGDMRDLIADLPKNDPVPAVSALATKLLLRTVATGAIPIVGKEYAWAILARMLYLIQQLPQIAEGDDSALLDARAGVAFSRFAAGLSLEFVDDDDLATAPFDKLRRFKDKNQDLLREHQVHMAEVAQGFEDLPDGKGFADALRELRLAAQRRRTELDAAARDAWSSFGFQLGRKALHGAIASLPPLLLLAHQRPLDEVVISLLPAAAVFATSLLDQAEKLKRQGSGKMAYLFEAERAFERSQEA